MAAVLSSPNATAAIGLAPLKISAAAGAATAGSSSGGVLVAPTNPISSAASTSTPTPAAPSPLATNCKPPHLNHYQPAQTATNPISSSTSTSATPTHTLSHQDHRPEPASSACSNARLKIKPVQPRKSLPAAPAATTLVNKMSMASVISPMPGPPGAKAPISMTTKEWVIPPRPKPGRKPATDTPPTKRKAQNRAAQRAFRERRAARVGELEEQLDAEREEHEKAQAALQEKIHCLEMDAQALQSRCEVLENMLDKERVERAREVGVLTRRLHEATHNHHSHQNHHTRQSLPSLSNVPESQGTFAPQPVRYHRPSAPSCLSQLGRASSSGLTGKSTPPAAAQPHRPTTTNPFSISQIISPPEDIELAPTSCGSCVTDGRCACAEEVMASMPVGCGNCTLGSRCQCLEEVLNGTANMSHPDNGSRTKSASEPQPTASRTAKRTIRSISPSSMAPEEKRPRPSLTLAAIETDFTSMFSRQQKRVSSSITAAAPGQPSTAPPNAIGTPYSNAPSPYSLAPVDSNTADSPAPEDRCGFCEDGTYCVCAEASNNAAALAPQAPPAEAVTLPPLTSRLLPIQQSRTPPPSEGDAIGYEILPDGAVKLPRLKGLSSRKKPTAGGCGSGGPGTCAQCLADPKSGLFCRSLAASFKGKNGEPGGGCCGGGVAGGGCCKDEQQNIGGCGGGRGSSRSSNGNASIKISCADAYKTLASHRNFSEAADDIGTWLPMLRAAPARPQEPNIGGCGGSSRTPIEVEAASIMGVLKGFDVRFGRGD